MSLRCADPRLEAALEGLPPSLPCPQRDCCALGRPDCRIFAPGWYCEDRGLVVLPSLLLDADHEAGGDDESNGDDEPDSDDEPDNDYG